MTFCNTNDCLSHQADDLNAGTTCPSLPGRSSTFKRANFLPGTTSHCMPGKVAALCMPMAIKRESTFLPVVGRGKTDG